MNDVSLMCGFEPLRDLMRNVESFLDRNRTACNAIGERFALHEFKHEKSLIVCFLEIVDRSDIRMVERCENLGLSLQSAHSICVTRELSGQNFDCDVALQFRITCAIHLAHSALT